MNRLRSLPVTLGTLCALAVFVLLTVGGGPRTPGSDVAIPDELAGYSYLTGNVSQAPPGRALAVYQHGFGVEFMDFPQGIVLAADDDVYRRLDAAENRAGRESQGDPGPMLLSPDGTSVALGEHNTSSPDIEFVNLETGEVTSQEVTDARSVLPVAWSPDGTRLAYVTRNQRSNPYSGSQPRGSLHVLDVGSGSVEPVPGGTKAYAAAYSPDGTRIAIQHGGDAGLEIVDLGTGDIAAIDEDGTLAGPNAWSPDGSLLAVIRSDEIWAIHVAGTPGAEAARVQLPGAEGPEMLGWTEDREVVTFDWTRENHSTVDAVSLETGESRELTRIDGTSNYGIYRFQLASDLIADLPVRVAGSADRGPTPLVLSVPLSLLVGFVTYLVLGWVGRRRDRDPGQSADGPGDDIDGSAPKAAHLETAAR